GVVLSHLNSVAARFGLMYGPDPASADRATLAGVIANNGTGAHSLIYGMSADHLISAEVLMADGTAGILGERSTLDNTLIASFYASVLTIREKYVDAITAHWPRAWRNSAGYRLNYILPWSPTRPSQWEGDYPASLKPGTLNLAQLLAGSEGTLAVIRRAKIRLVEKPKHTILAVLAYQSNADACDDVPRLLTHRPSAIELIPRFIIRQARSVPAYARQMGWVLGDPAALLVIEFSGDQPSELLDAAHGIGDVLTIAETREDQARIWNVRKVGLGLLDSRPQSERPAAFIEDCAIPVDRLGEFVREVERTLSTHGTEGGIYAHASAGCLHIRPILNLKKARGVSDLRSISEEVLALTLRLGGSMSSEHGDGLARAEFLEQIIGSELMNATRMLKRAADPDGLLNPGKILDAPKMDRNLRYGPGYGTRVWQSNLSFAHSGGLEIAIEQCNGQGLCRKDFGVMCPSYQVTREEMHSTRGRANLLRALIRSPWTSDHGPSSAVQGLSSYDPEKVESVAQALDLCLACKGCKAECPSGVDMARLKFAFQAEYYKTHPRQLRDYIFGYFHIAAGLAAAIAPISNAMMEIEPVRKLFVRILGITDRRPFPQFKRQTRHARLSEAMDLPASTGKPRVIFLPDAFARYLEPETEQAALEILHRCRLDVHILPVIGAGASLYSKGFIGAAQDHAARVLDALNKMDPSGNAALVGIEPPEVYFFKDEYMDLLPGRSSEIEGRLKNTWLLDEFLLRSKEFNDLRIVSMSERDNPENNPKRSMRFHPHCHQRAEGLSSDGYPAGTAATLDLLRSCGYEVELLDTGCCGMAGTFGYEAEHYELSMKVGELKLFPMLRHSEGKNSSLDTGTQESSIKNQNSRVLSSGAACRMQIRQGTGVEAIHPILLVANFLKELTNVKA
ncbi:MAG: FAD-binding and (Fe-S)-binding domain-containing protein, partial [Syntrophothermus sp.]